MKRKLQNWLNTEKGQSLVEFAIILPILILLLTLPVDYFRYINTKMLLNSAASESIGELSYTSASSGNPDNDIKQTLKDCYGDRLDSDKVQISIDKGIPEEKDYTYYVYSSAKADPDPLHFGEQFEERPSSYECMEVQMRFSYEMSPVTYWGTVFLDDTFEVKTPTYTRKIYAGGYTP